MLFLREFGHLARVTQIKAFAAYLGCKYFKILNEKL
jgi:hypothetical protein